VRSGTMAGCGLAVAALALVGVGCGGSDSSTGTGSSSSASAKAVPIEWGPYCQEECQAALALQASQDSIDCKVGFALAGTGFPYGAATKLKSEEAAKKFFPNMDLSITDAQNDTSKQTNDIDTLLARDIDVLITNPVEQKAMVPAVKRAVDAGVKVVTIDRTVDTPVLTSIKADDFALGKADAEYIVKRLKGKGNVVEIQAASGASPTINRHNGFDSVIKENPGIKVIASQTGNNDRATSLKVMEDILQRFPDGIDAVFVHADNMSLGVIQAIKAAGRQDEMFVVGVDGQDSAFKEIADGNYAATAVYPVVVPMNIIAAAKACADEEIPEKITLDSPLVTKENVSEYMGTNFSG
jgi:ribose transport system substrate-binding protein